MNQAASTTYTAADRRDHEESAVRSAHGLYVGMAVAFLITLFVGFARTFYLRPASQPALAPLVVVHGIVFSAWFVLFFVQTTLVAAGRTNLHRRLGLAGAALAVLIVGLGLPVAIPAARAGRLPGDPLAFLLVMLGDLAGFAVFVGAAIYHRRRAETHKRLMVLAAISLLPPAISRWPIAVGRPAVIAAVLIALLAASPVYDLVVLRRVNRVSLWGGLALFLSVPVRFALSQTETWHRIARWLIG